MPSERFMRHYYGASGYVDPAKSGPKSVDTDRTDRTNQEPIFCVCGHVQDGHAQYQWSCFVRNCDCVEFRISDGPRAKHHLNRIVLSLQRNGYSGPETLKDYLKALDDLLAVVVLETKECSARPAQKLEKLDHFFTPDPTKRFCVVCGDNDLGSVWGVHRFQIQPGDPDFRESK